MTHSAKRVLLILVFTKVTANLVRQRGRDRRRRRFVDLERTLAA